MPGDLGRQADDAAVDVGRARRGDDAGDLLGGGDRDRVGVDVDPGVPGGGDLARDVEGGVRRADRQDHRGPRDQPVERHPGQLGRQRAPGRRPGPPGRIPEHLVPDRDQAAADGGPHLPGMQQPDGRHRASSALGVVPPHCAGSPRRATTPGPNLHPTGICRRASRPGPAGLNDEHPYHDPGWRSPGTAVDTGADGRSGALLTRRVAVASPTIMPGGVGSDRSAPLLITPKNAGLATTATRPSDR